MSIVNLLQDFLDRNASYLTVRHGAGLSKGELDSELERLDVRLPAAVREVLTRWGWLELMVSKELWPHTMFADGLQFFGLGDAPAGLSLEHELRRFETAISDPPFFRFNNEKGLAGRTPVFGTLEGLANSWVANSRSVKWFNDYASRWDEILREEGSNSDTPLFEVTDVEEVVTLLLQRLQYRVERARVLAALARELGPVEVDGAQNLASGAYPGVQWMVKPYHGHPVVRAVRTIGVVESDRLAAVGAHASPIDYQRAYPDVTPTPHEAWLTFRDATGIGTHAATIATVLSAAGELVRGERDALDVSALPTTISDFSAGDPTRWLARR